jgi:hypothetical protein
MNGASPVYAMTSPLASPTAPHTSSGASSAGTSPYWLAQAATTPPSANTDPTDRSMPPVMMTNVIPSATTTRNDDWMLIPVRLSNVAKESNTTDATRTDIRRTASAPCRCASAAIRSLRATRATGTCRPDASVRTAVMPGPHSASRARPPTARVVTRPARVGCA